MRDMPPIRIGIGLIVIVGLIVGVGGIVASDDRPPIGQAPPINNSTTAGEEVLTQSQSTNESPQTYAVTARSADAIDTTQLAEYGEVGTQADARIQLTMSSSDVESVENIPWVVNVRPIIRSNPAQTDIPGSSDGESLGVQRAHQNGITGEDVDIGIIDTGFDPDSQAIASNVVRTESFRSSRGSPAHGTSVAEIVTQTAPSSRLHLVSVRDRIDTAAAIDYLRLQNVDIIVHSRGNYVMEDDGDHFYTDKVNSATDSGILFINAAGNSAQRHWEGEFRDTNLNDFHEWTVSGDELNALPDSNSDFSGGKVNVFVRWESDDDFSSYKPYLYNPVTNEYIAEGKAFDETGDRLATGTNQYASLFAEIDQQPLSLVIEHIQGPADDEIEVIVSSGPQEIQRNIPASSILAPADVPAALTVAAYQVGSGQIAPYSSRGPVDDGRTGIDLTGYTNIVVSDEYGGVLTGTSAAAPYVGGVAALVEDSQPGDQSPTELTDTLTSSSDDILDSGIDTISGAGVVNAVDAVNIEGTEAPDSDLQAEFLTDNGQIATDDAQISFNGSAPGKSKVIVVFVGPSGQAIAQPLSVDNDGTFGKEDFSLAFRSATGTLNEGTVSAHIISSGRDDTFGDNFARTESAFADIIATGRSGPNGEDFSDNSNTGGQIRELILANSVDDTASDDLLITETFQFVTVEEQEQATDVSRTASSGEVAPGEQVTLTTEITGASGSVSTSSSYDPQLNSAAVASVTVNGASVDPLISEATVNGSTVTLGDIGTDATVIIIEELSMGDQLNITHTITGDVTTGGTTEELDPVSVTVADTEPQSVVDEFDADGNGDISIIELGQAGQAFASGELSITELGQIGAAFAS